MGLLAQDGGVGAATTKLGEFVLAAFEVVGTVVVTSGVPGKVAGTVGEEILEVVEFTSGAVTKVSHRCKSWCMCVTTVRDGY